MTLRTNLNYLLLGGAIVCILGMQGGTPNVRLQSTFPGEPQVGNINVSKSVGARGFVVQDMPGDEGFIEFPGEPRIYSRNSLIGPQGDPGEQGEQGEPGEQGEVGPAGGGGLVAQQAVFGSFTWQEDGLVAQMTMTFDEAVVVVLTGQTALTNNEGAGIASVNLTLNGSIIRGTDLRPFASQFIPINISTQFPLAAGTYTFGLHTRGTVGEYFIGDQPILSVLAFASP